MPGTREQQRPQSVCAFAVSDQRPSLLVDIHIIQYLTLPQFEHQPDRHTTLKQHRFRVDSMSTLCTNNVYILSWFNVKTLNQRCLIQSWFNFDIESTLNRRGFSVVYPLGLTFAVRRQQVGIQLDVRTLFVLRSSEDPFRTAVLLYVCRQIKTFWTIILINYIVMQ